MPSAQRRRLLLAVRFAAALFVVAVIVGACGGTAHGLKIRPTGPGPGGPPARKSCRHRA